jgi:hypothetical protein
MSKTMNQNSLYIRAKEILKELLLQADTLLNDHNNLIVPSSLSKEETDTLDIIIETCEQRKAVLTVLITLLSYKIVVPKQDIRKHQANMEGGFSGRTFDTQIITPFMKENGFPAMVESGWLTARWTPEPIPSFDASFAVNPPLLLGDAFLLNSNPRSAFF